MQQHQQRQPQQQQQHQQQHSQQQQHASSITLLDGGMGHLLKADIRHSHLPFELQFLASCLACCDEPGPVRAAHTSYVQAGARVITTNSFVATRHSLARVNRAADLARLVDAAGALARQAAAAAAPHRVLVAGSLPPLLDSYQTAGLLSHEAMLEQYAAIARGLAPHVDLLLAETLCSVAEARAALQAAAQAAPGTPVWLSFSLEDSGACCLRDKTPLVAAVTDVVAAAAAAAQPTAPASLQLQALLVNCCAPAAVTAAMPVLARAAPAGVRVGAYANGFRTTTTEWLSSSVAAEDAGQAAAAASPPPPAGDYDADGMITPAAYLRHARDWVAAGARIVGGCCGVGPQHIRLLAQQLLLQDGGGPQA